MTVREKSHTWVYVVLAVAIAALMIAGVALYERGQDTRAAHAKAKEFIAALQDAGYRAPDEDVLVELFGSDGGAAAEDPAAALLRWQYVTQLGTAGPAGRAVILDPDFVKAEELFLQVYAPDKLAGFKDFVKGLKLDETQ